MIRWLRDRRYANLRARDLSILWPACRAVAPDLEWARLAFARHAYNDPAWLALGKAGIADIIGRLE